MNPGFTLVGNHSGFLAVLFVCGAAWAAEVPGHVVRPVHVEPGPARQAGFTWMPSEATGLTFTNELRGDSFLTNAVAHNGSGLALGDVDGDGWTDLYLCRLDGPNQLYRNLGQWRFEAMDAGEAACAGQFSTGAVFADVDGDRDLDLLVNGIAAGTRLFLNDGKGTWQESTNAGLSRTASPTSMALADIDGDGDLDLYCTHYIDVMHLADPTTRFALAKRAGQWEITKVNGQSALAPRWKDRFEVLPDAKVRELPELDGFYRNDGTGRFTPIISEPGLFSNAEGGPIAAFRDWGLAVMFRDINGDGAPDFHVCNDNASPDRMWINSGRGTFRLVEPLKLRHTSRSSMGLDFADVDRDGRDDFIVVDMFAREHSKRMTQLVRDQPDASLRERVEEQPRFNRNMLFMGRSGGSFSERAFLAGVAATDWSWCPIFLDVDLDGFEDLLVSNGFSFDVMDQDSHDVLRKSRLTPDQLKRSRQLHPRWATPNAAFRNRRDGTFEPMGLDWGFDRPGISCGMALADLDNDGDLDVVVNNLNEIAGVYRNESAAGRIAVRLRGLPPNTQGIGARIRVSQGSLQQSQEMISGGRYMSDDEALRVFAAVEKSEAPIQVEVKWRDGTVTTLQARPNQIVEVRQGDAAKPAPAAAPSQIQATLFKDASSLLDHIHTEDVLDDWTRQPLLPRGLSRLGPGVAWYDWNADGWEDLIVTAGGGGTVAAFMNEGGRGFRRVEGFALNKADQGAVLGWPDGNGNRQLLVAHSPGETTGKSESQIAAYNLANPAAPRKWATGAASLGPLASADLDGDGDLDLFTGGRFQPGRYPEPVSSTVWINDQGVLRQDEARSKVFESLGLVTGAVLSDWDGDGDPDLALALEWGSPRTFRNDSGGFEEITGQLGLSGATGLWTSIATGDFDGDGRLDLAVGNWGRNTPYELHQPGSVRLYYGNWNEDGNLELIEAWKSGERWLPTRDRSWLARALPGLDQRFSTHTAYAGATIQDVLGPRFSSSKTVEATVLESSIFLNRGTHFERVALPIEAQETPVMALNVGDFDADGKEDLFLSQNFFGAASDISREDSGRGLWLRGLGNGTFKAADAGLIGIEVYGEQRGAALADFNQDGRIDVVISQNSGSTRLYVNQGPRRGVRVVLHGRRGNPDAIGAQMAVVYTGSKRGPVRSIQAGAGYWSQDGAAQVLGFDQTQSQTPVAVWVRWPGGQEQTAPLQSDQFEIRVQQNE